MARANRPASRPVESTLDDCLAEARAGKPSALYLFDGDPFLTLRSARELASLLIPEGQRTLNLVELDAAASPAEVASEAATRGLFGGFKVVLVQEPAFLQSKEDLAESFERARNMWSDGRQREAVRRLLAIAAKAGWSAKDLDPSVERAPTATKWKKELGIEVGGAERFLADAAQFARERDMKAAKDDSSALDELLKGGLPPGHVLLIASGKVDGRLPLVKRLAAAGRRVTIAVQTEGQWNDQRLVLGPVLEALLAGTGKTIDRGAEQRLAALVGADARTLAAEVAKLVAFVGDRKVIRAADVDETVVRVAADAFFALGNAVEERNLEVALGVLQRSLENGDSPHMLLGSLAATVRRLIVERERGRVASGGKRIGSYEEWNTMVLPSISEEELKGKKPYGFWMKYQASARFSREELLSALAELAEVDHAMKLGGDGPILLERVLFHLLTQKERRTA